MGARTREPGGADPPLFISFTQSAEREDETRTTENNQNGNNEPQNQDRTFTQEDETRTTENNQNGNNEPQNQDRTFTQEEVNRIVQERLAKEKSKLGADLEQRLADIESRERQLRAQELCSAYGIDKRLISAINMSSDEALENSIKILKEINDTQGAAQPTGNGATVIGTGNPIGSIDRTVKVQDADTRAAMGL